MRTVRKTRGAVLSVRAGFTNSVVRGCLVSVGVLSYYWLLRVRAVFAVAFLCLANSLHAAGKRFRLS